MSNQKIDPLEPVPRYEFIETQKEVRAAKVESDRIIASQTKRVDDVIASLTKDYYTKEGVKDQFKIELSDYSAWKKVSGVIAVAVLGLLFAVVQQYIINIGSK